MHNSYGRGGLGRDQEEVRSSKQQHISPIAEGYSVLLRSGVSLLREVFFLCVCVFFSNAAQRKKCGECVFLFAAGKAANL